MSKNESTEKPGEGTRISVIRGVAAPAHSTAFEVLISNGDHFGHRDAVNHGQAGQQEDIQFFHKVTLIFTASVLFVSDFKTDISPFRQWCLRISRFDLLDPTQPERSLDFPGC